MRLRRTQRWAVCLLAALAPGNVSVLAQQASAKPDSSAAIVVNNLREGEVSVAGTKRLVPFVVSLQTLVSEALEQNPEIIAMHKYNVLFANGWLTQQQCALC